MQLNDDLQLLDSTVTALGSGASYTGQWMDAKNFNRICGSIFIQTTGGNLFIEQSPDGTNADISPAAIAVVAGTPNNFNVTRQLPFVRMRYVQGAGVSGTVRLYMYGSSN